MGRYFVRAVDPSLLPPNKSWAMCETDGDIYFCVPEDGRPVEIAPDVLDALLPRVQAVYARQDTP